MTRARDIASGIISALKTSNINNAAATTGGLAIDSSGVVTGGLPSPGRNLLYNGAMQVAQRGTSVTGITTTGYYTADRWNRGVNTMGTWTHTIENDAPTGSGFSKSMKFLCTTADASPAAGDFNTLGQQLEGQDLQRIKKGTSSAEQLTLSFWVKSNVTGTYIVELVDSDNTRSVSASYTISASATWEKKTITFPADTTGAFDNDNNGSFQPVWFLGAGSTFTSGTLNTIWNSTVNANRAVGQTNLAAATNNYWQITGVQLEVGPTATGFEFKSYGEELAECQRYFTCYRATGSGNEGLGIAQASSSSQAFLEYLLPEHIRTAPTSIVVSSGAHFAASNSGFSGSNAFTTAALSLASTRSALISFTGGSGLTAGDATSIRSQNSAAYIFFNGMEL